MNDSPVPCPICAASTELKAVRDGKFFKEQYRFRNCPQCRFIFVENPSTNFAEIYNEAYYRGKGADEKFDYVQEFDHPHNNVRTYDWRGIVKAVNALKPLNADSQWLDYGCGSGGAVRYARENTVCRAVGFDEGWMTGYARARGVPILERSDLKTVQGTFDVVTAIEVIEHTIDPVSVLKEIRTLLKPGGLLLVTTGNASAFRKGFFEWSYVVPEIHVSYFEPQSLSKAMELAGFRPEIRASIPGFDDILRFKILKNLGVRETSIFEKILPWPLLTYAANLRFKVTGHPIGWAT